MKRPQPAPYRFAHLFSAISSDSEMSAAPRRSYCRPRRRPHRHRCSRSFPANAGAANMADVTDAPDRRSELKQAFADIDQLRIEFDQRLNRPRSRPKLTLIEGG